MNRLKGFVRIYKVNRSNGFGPFTSARYARYQFRKDS